MPRTRLREAREQADLTQAELAERIGAERRAVMGWEAGTHKPSAYSRRRVRKVLKNQDKLLFALDGEISNEPDVKESNELDVEEPNEEQDLQPCYVDAVNDKVNASDSHQSGIQGSDEELASMDKSRRTLAQTLGLGGLSLVGNVNLSILSGPVIEPEECLAQCGITIDSCWEWFNQGNFHKIERLLHRTLPTLTKLATSVWPHQGTAARLAAQANIIQTLLATRKLDFVGREFYCEEAVRFGELSGNRGLLAVALDWYGNTYTVCYRQPEKAIFILNNALSGPNSESSSLVKSAIYSNLSIAHAQDKDETKAKKNEKLARDYAAQARLLIPEKPELDPLYQYIRWNQSELDALEGKSYLYLAEHFPDGDYAQMAHDALVASTSKQAVSQDSMSASLIKQADAARMLRRMRDFVKSLEQGIRIATEEGNKRRISEANDVMGRIPSEWWQETVIKNLQDDLRQATIEVYRQ